METKRAYAPKLGSKTAQLIQHLETLPQGQSISTIQLADAVVVQANCVAGLLKSAVDNGVVTAKRPLGSKHTHYRISTPADQAEHQYRQARAQQVESELEHLNTDADFGPPVMPSPNLATASVFALGQSMVSETGPISVTVHAGDGSGNPEVKAAVLQAIQTAKNRPLVAGDKRTRDGLRCALWNDGTLVLQTEFSKLELTATQTRELVHYLECMAVSDE